MVGSGQALDRWAKLAATALDNVQHHLPDGLRALLERPGCAGSASNPPRL